MTGFNPKKYKRNVEFHIQPFGKNHYLKNRFTRFIDKYSGKIIKATDYLIAIMIKSKNSNNAMLNNITQYEKLSTEIQKFYFNPSTRSFFEYIISIKQKIEKHETVSIFDYQIYQKIFTKKSLFSRIIKFVISGLCTLGLSPISLIALLGRYSIHKWKNDIVCISPVKTNMPDISNITLMTHNVQMSEFKTMNIIDDDFSTSDRSKIWIEWFINLENKPSILGLQELFDPDTAKWIGDQLSNLGYWVTYSCKPSKKGVGMGSGLLLASKYPITTVAFQPYEYCAGYGKWANKGILGGIINIGDRNILTMVTHSQAGLGDTNGHYHEVDKEVNIGDNIEINMFFEKFTNFDFEMVFLMGDLNKGTLKNNLKKTEYDVDNDYWLLENLESLGWKNLTCLPDTPAEQINKEGRKQVMGTTYDTDMPHFQHWNLFIKHCKKNNWIPNLARTSSKLDHIMIREDGYSKIAEYKTEILRSSTDVKLASDHTPVYTTIHLY